MTDHFRFHARNEHLASAFGSDDFGKVAESFARLFGTPVFLIAQTILVIIWIAANAVAILHFDPYPFILLNLAFSTQAAYAAPLILLAQTRQADRDRAMADADARHREELAKLQLDLLDQNTELTRQIAQLASRIDTLTREMHGKIVRSA